MTLSTTLKLLRSHGDPRNIVGMQRYGITARKAYGVAAPHIRSIAKNIGINHKLSLQLWSTAIHEARILASLIGDPERVTERQMKRWVHAFDSWAVCDACCGCLFDKTPFAYRKAFEWCSAKEEFVKRAGFVMMAELAVHNKKAADAEFLRMLPAIKRGATDGRNFVKKAVNWALRQIGKRNPALNKAAIRTAQEISEIDSPVARWVAADALRELQSPAVKRRLLSRAVRSGMR
ncbi:MAG TPA: DNA alkylation repair protein [Bacteroidota bacterium]